MFMSEKMTCSSSDWMSNEFTYELVRMYNSLIGLYRMKGLYEKSKSDDKIE
jgi:hypothetical protein